MSAAAPIVLKIVVAGGFGSGKTTLVGAVSEIEPLNTEEYLTTASVHTDHLTGVEAKTTTTVAVDFGRRTLTAPEPIRLLLFGTPGQERFWFTWDDLVAGAVGAVVLADTRRLQDSFPALGYFEARGLPFVVAVNEFATAEHRYTAEEVRRALDLPDPAPGVLCDARSTPSAAGVLITLVRYALTRARSASGVSP
ncbi:ATP/GTP-binding protein [Streptomyces sp. NPDC046977]|uniref:GTP-binding protein n=1 Tax=Streptomyces sp. NPDC046977 TaxID=3154703 RepID=UPI0033EECDC8